MAQYPTYEEGYKNGIRVATAPIDVYNVADLYVNEILEHRRKELLTKKVTKWVRICYDSNNGVLVVYPGSFLYNTEQEALGGPAAWEKIKTTAHPIEIEVPL